VDGVVVAGDATLFYTSMGYGDPVMIVHGGPGLDHTYLLPQMEELAGSFRLIFYDQRATGLSTGSPDSAAITIRQFVEDIEILRESLGLESVHLLGHSWGGLLSMAYAVKYPERVRSLVLVASLGASHEVLPEFALRRAIRTTTEDSTAMASLQSSPAFAQGDSAVVSQYLRYLFRSYFYRAKLANLLSLGISRRTAGNLFAVWGEFLDELSTYDLRPELSSLDVPTLIIHGSDDVVPLSFAEELRQIIPGSALVVLDSCGHFPYIERPDLFFPAVSEFFMDTRIGR